MGDLAYSIDRKTGKRKTSVVTSVQKSIAFPGVDNLVRVCNGGSDLDAYVMGFEIKCAHCTGEYWTHAPAVLRAMTDEGKAALEDACGIQWRGTGKSCYFGRETYGHLVNMHGVEHATLHRGLALQYYEKNRSICGIYLQSCAEAVRAGTAMPGSFDAYDLDDASGFEAPKREQVRAVIQGHHDRLLKTTYLNLSSIPRDVGGVMCCDAAAPIVQRTQVRYDPKPGSENGAGELERLPNTGKSVAKSLESCSHANTRIPPTK